MLVHIPTMGCLVSVWLGDYEKNRNNHGTVVEYPKYVFCTLKNIELENPEDWQEIETNSSLGKKILLYYPDIKPILNERGILFQVFSFFFSVLYRNVNFID